LAISSFFVSLEYKPFKEVKKRVTRRERVWTVRRVGRIRRMKTVRKSRKKVKRSMKRIRVRVYIGSEAI
jgi:hypothetical protein